MKIGLIVVAFLLVFAGFAIAASVKTYADPEYTIRKDSFLQGETVYTKAIGLHTEGEHGCDKAKIEYYHFPESTPRYTRVCEDGTCYSDDPPGILWDSLPLSHSDPTGVWKAVAYRSVRDHCGPNHNDHDCEWQFAGHHWFNVYPGGSQNNCTIDITSPSDGSVFLIAERVTATGNARCGSDANPNDYYVVMDWGDGTSSPHLPVSGPSGGTWSFTTNPDYDHYYGLNGDKQITSKLYRVRYCAMSLLGSNSNGDDTGGSLERMRCDTLVAEDYVGIVINIPPVSVPGASQTVILGNTAYFDGSASFDLDGTIVSYHWTFGDGTSADGVEVSHRYLDIGNYSVTLTVTDNLGASDENGLSVHVVPPRAERITISPENITISVGGIREYTATAHDSDGNEWDVTDECLFTSDGGNFSGNAFTAGGTVGNYTVTATYSLPVWSDHEHLTASTNVYIIRGEASGISISPKNATSPILGTVTYEATANDGYGNEWDVTSETVFSSPAGTFEGETLHVGTVAGVFGVIGTYGPYSDNASITVTHGQAASLLLSPEHAVLGPNGIQDYTATVSDEYGNEWDATALTTFSSDGGSFSGNELTAVAVAGEYTVYGTFGLLNATADLTVVMGDITGITISPENAVVGVGGTVVYHATAHDAYGNTEDVTGETAFSSDAGVFSGNELTAGETPGTFEVSASYEEGGLEAYTNVTVVPEELPPNQIAYITISPQDSLLIVGGTRNFLVTAHDAQGHDWDVTGLATLESNGGTFNGGLFAAGPTPGVYYVRATVIETVVNDTFEHLANTTITLFASDEPQNPGNETNGNDGGNSGGSSYGFTSSPPQKPAEKPQTEPPAPACQKTGSACNANLECCTDLVCASGICKTKEKPAPRGIVDVIAPEYAEVGSRVPIIVVYVDGGDPVKGATVRVVTPSYEVITLKTDNSGSASFVPDEPGRYDYLVPDYEMKRPVSTYARTNDNAKVIIRRWEAEPQDGETASLASGLFLFGLAPEILGLIVLVLLLSAYGMYRIYSENQEPVIQLDVEPLIPLRKVRTRKPKEPGTPPADEGQASIEVLKGMIEGEKES